MTRWSTTPHGGHTVVYDDDIHPRSGHPAGERMERQPVWYLIPPSGPNVAVYRDPDEGQWGISINTEDMPISSAFKPRRTIDHDEAGCPYIEVTINGGQVYDHTRESPPGAMTEHEAIKQIEGILQTDQWSVGMLKDIAEIVRRTGIKHPNPPEYNRH